MSKKSLQSLFAIPGPSKIDDLVARVIIANVEIEIFLGDALKQKGYSKDQLKYYFLKIELISNEDLKKVAHQFRLIRNECAHESLQVSGARKVVELCNHFIERIYKLYGDQHTDLLHKRCLISAATILHSELSKHFDYKSSRPIELDGFYYPGEKTLSDEIDEVLGH